MFAMIHACQPRPTRVVHPSYYYWKTVFNLEPDDLGLLDEFGVKKLYVRFFDVSWNGKFGQPMPSNELYIYSSVRFTGEVVPVIYITQEAMRKAKSEDIDALAGNILALTVRLAKRMGMEKLKDLQMDCDWTPATREKYFSLLDAIDGQKKDHLVEGTVSSTLRLHQVKFSKKAGVPPVQKATLMVYHTTSPFDLEPKNSILDPDEAIEYLKNIQDYPLKLDVAIPIFSWVAQYDRYGRFIRLLNNPDLSALEANTKIRNKGGNIKEVMEDTFLGDRRLMEGDILRLDEPKMEDSLRVVRFLRGRLKDPTLDLIFFHFDEKAMRRFIGGDYEKFEKILAF
jgi:hypothetical protein